MPLFFSCGPNILFVFGESLLMSNAISAGMVRYLILSILIEYWRWGAKFGNEDMVMVYDIITPSLTHRLLTTKAVNAVPTKNRNTPTTTHMFFSKSGVPDFQNA